MTHLDGRHQVLQIADTRYTGEKDTHQSSPQGAYHKRGNCRPWDTSSPAVTLSPAPHPLYFCGSFIPDTWCPVIFRSREPIPLSKQNTMFMKYIVRVGKHCSFFMFYFQVGYCWGREVLLIFAC